MLDYNNGILLVLLIDWLVTLLLKCQLSGKIIHIISTLMVGFNETSKYFS